MNPVFSPDIRNAIRTLARGPDHDIDAMSAIRDALPSPGTGLKILRNLADEEFSDGCPDTLHQEGLTLVEAVQDIANEARRGTDPAHERVMTRFLNNIGLVDSKPASIDASPQETDSGNAADHPSNRPSQDSATASEQNTAKPADNANRANSTDSAIPDGKPRSATSERQAVPSQGIRSGPEQDRGFPAGKAPWNPLDDYVGPVLIHSGPSAQPDSHLSADEFRKIPALLPPPPAGEDGTSAGRWFEGEIWHPLCFNIRIDSGKENHARELFEMLQRFHSLPEAAFRKYETRAPMDADAGLDQALNLHRRARDLGGIPRMVEAAGNALFKSVMNYYNRYDSRTHADLLARIGFDLVIDPKLAVIVAGALDIENFLVETGPESAGEGSAHDIRGTVSETCRLDQLTMLDRAVFLHFSTSTPLADNMVQSLVELRHAQCCRHHGREIEPGNFDATFDRDWFTALDAFDRNPEQPAGP